MPDYGLGIAEAFQKYLKTGDNRLIESYSAKELKKAVSHLSPYYNHNKQWFRTLERRIEELKHIEQANGYRKVSLREKIGNRWSDRATGFGLGVLAGILISVI